MKRVSLLFTFFTFLFSCAQNIELGKTKIDLKKFPLNIDVHYFYKEQIETYNKSLELYDQGKTDEAYSNELLKNYKGVEGIDTLHIKDSEYLLIYEMQGMQTKDTLATFGNIKFEQLNMISNNDNEFQSLRAESFSYKDDKKNFKDLITVLETEYGSPTVFKANESEIYKWSNKDIIVLITLVIQTENDIESYYYSNFFLIKRSESNKLKRDFSKISGYWDLDWNLLL
ncbi:hypothetical protein [Psychroserpens sp. NJDZ02]|uniref:hypothetical protein n=1 Tax=Psychroserpens sp. NJDZ02 TaxID=2570561 RepID=UPI0010A82A5E|nr:hypothetical protein [Psychroserpens sp. NJDZ02]QCE40360.1 hypothetical protein E9099_02655 [Psychroserpens sp. NJDZ02]